MPELKGKRELFCREYIVDHDQTEAAKRAGYSSRSAYNQGSRLMKDDEIRERIREMEGNVAEKLGLTKHLVASQVVAILKADPRKILKWSKSHGSSAQLTLPVEMRGSEELDDFTAAAISEINFNKDGNPTIKLHSKTAVLKLAAEIVGLVGSDSQDNGEGPGKIEVDLI